MTALIPKSTVDKTTSSFAHLICSLGHLVTYSLAHSLTRSLAHFQAYFFKSNGRGSICNEQRQQQLWFGLARNNSHNYTCNVIRICLSNSLTLSLSQNFMLFSSNMIWKQIQKRTMTTTKVLPLVWAGKNYHCAVIIICSFDSLTRSFPLTCSLFHS